MSLTVAPRVRVEAVEWGIGPLGIDWTYAGRCDGCGRQGDGAHSWNEAVAQAHRHAATCPALRLARLLAELRALRDRLRQWGYADQALAAKVGNTYLEGSGRAREITAVDLDRVIREAT